MRACDESPVHAMRALQICVPFAPEPGVLSLPAIALLAWICNVACNQSGGLAVIGDQRERTKNNPGKGAQDHFLR